MLTEEQNRTLTQIGPGTPMGDLLRRYWQPIAAEAEFDALSVRPVRLLGEDLVLYKDRSGTLGLIERVCAHRLTDLAYGLSEDYGLRCPLHGWLYNEAGLCLDMPMEPEPFLDEVRLTAYPVESAAGLVWAYLGPAPAPMLPQWEPFTWSDALVQIVFTVLDCNWLQCQENAMDPFGEEWLQQSMLPSGPSVSSSEISVLNEEFQFGFHSKAVVGNPESDALSSGGQTCLWPNGYFAGDSRSCRFEWRVPIEDERTLDIAMFIDRVAPGHELAPGERFHFWQGRLTEDDSAGSPYLTTHVLNRKFKLWLTQKRTLDRTKENLVESTDRGVILLRDKYFSQLEVVSDGGEPKAIIRDAVASRSLPLPISDSAAPNAPEAGESKPGNVFPYIAGQPPEVEEIYARVRSSWDSARGQPG